ATAIVSDNALSALSAFPNLTEQSSSSVTVATFSDSDGNTSTGLYSAPITWGDGQTSNGSISYANGLFTVTGSHAYADEGSYALSVRINDSDGASVTVSG